jgi:hypothetical protein
MKRALIYTSMSFIGLVLTVGVASAQKGGHGGGGGHGGSGHGSGGQSGGRPSAGQGRARPTSGPASTRSNQNAPNKWIHTEEWRNPSGSPPVRTNHDDGSRHASSSSVTASPNQSGSKNAAGKPNKASTTASGKPRTAVNKNSGTAQKGKNNKPRPGTKPDQNKRDKLNAIAAKITSAVLNAALTSLADGINPGSAGMAALSEFVGQDDCPLDESERGCIRESMSAWETSSSDGGAVEGEEPAAC